MVIHCGTNEIEHRIVRDLPELLSPGDLIVRNDTKVLSARVTGVRTKTGGKWGGLFLRESEPGSWEMLAQTRGSPATGEAFRTTSGLKLTLMGRTAEGHWLMTPSLPGSAVELLTSFGSIPLPPYIRDGTASDADCHRYQTIYARTPGSVAAPTAGLHFTPELLDRLAEKGVTSANVTLHVGLGTFAPIKEDDPLKHVIHEEWCSVDPITVDAIRLCKGRVIAIGTTTTRTLETAAQSGALTSFCAATSLAIYPPFNFRVVQCLLTNFHLPRTTLLLLVQSLCGSDLLKFAYEEAIRHEYRFYSYGDAMLIL